MCQCVRVSVCKRVSVSVCEDTVRFILSSGCLGQTRGFSKGVVRVAMRYFGQGRVARCEVLLPVVRDVV